MELAVIIVNYNQKALLLQCLEAVRYALLGIQSEIILVDNNSRDDSVAAVRVIFPDVRIIVNERNYGFAYANNQGVKISSGKILFFLNNDTKVQPKAIRILLDFLGDYPEAGLVGARLLNPDGSAQRQGGALWPFWNSPKPVSVSFLPAAAVMITRELFEKIGGFDENFFFYNEDLDLCRRLKKAGYKIYFIPEATVLHFGGQSTENLGRQAIVEGYLGGLRYCYKHYPRLIFYIYRLAVGLELKFKLWLAPGPAANVLGEKKQAWLEILKRYQKDEKIYKI